MRWLLVLSICVITAVQPAFAISVAYGGMIFFRPGSVELSPQGARTIEDLANTYRARGLAENELIVVGGNTDSVEASEALSQARGDMVRQRLVGLGIPFERIVVFAHGDSSPLVRTPLQTPEAQNRYVYIRIFTPSVGAP
jgi:outer membrane protein OmpA-like peptidoglycan-associated protein